MFGSQGATTLPLCCSFCGHPQRVSAKVCGACGRTLGAPYQSLQAYRAFQAGDILDNGHYTVQRMLLRGGMGTIYLATDHHTFGRTVVIKAMLDYFDPANPQEEQAAHQRFTQEAETLARLRHRAIPQIHKHFQQGSQHFIVMEYIEGHDLEQQLTARNGQGSVIQQGQAYAEKDAIRWGVALCDVLEYLASIQPHPIVHRDIKPANLILDQNSKDMRLVDFGTAQTRWLGASARPQAGASGAFGTHGYAPPEQYRGQTEPRSDVYALAATLYHLATDDDPRLHPPFHFPEINRLGKFGNVLSAGLTQDVTKRPTAQQWRPQLEKLLAPPQRSRIQAIEAPDGTYVADAHALAQWCEQHWKDAAAWLYQGEILANQIARLWGKNKLAHDLRAVIQQHPNDPNAGLDTLLAKLDLSGFDISTPELHADHQLIDFGPIGISSQTTKQLTIRNTGRRYVRAELHPPPWIRVVPATIELVPGESVVLSLTATLRRALSRMRVTNTLEVSQNGTSLLQLAVQGAILTPDGVTVVRTQQELVEWCERHWRMASQWLYDGLLAQVACLWQDCTLAEELRQISQLYKDEPSQGLDAVLARLDPQSYALAPDMLSVDAAHVGLYGAPDRPGASKTVTLTNGGRRLLNVRPIGHGWITVTPQQATLAPGISAALEVQLDTQCAGHERTGNSVQIFKQTQLLQQIVVFTPLRAPDHTWLPTEAALANWCVEHWDTAAAWLYNDLPDQIMHKWGQPSLARQLRAVVDQHPNDRHAGMNTALDVLEPTSSTPQIQTVEMVLDFGILRAAQAQHRSLQLTNIGRRALAAQFDLPPWISADTKALHLLPGQKAVVQLTARPHSSSIRRKMRDHIQLDTAGGHLALVPVQATLPRRAIPRQLVRMYPKAALLVSIVIALVLLRTAIWGYGKGYVFWHYRQCVGALEQGDWAGVRAECSTVLAVEPDNQEAKILINESHYRAAQSALKHKAWAETRRELSAIPGYRDTADLMKQSYYYPAIEAIQSWKWSEAAREVVSLESLDTRYRDIPDLLAQNPSLLQEVGRLRAGAWLKGRAVAQQILDKHNQPVTAVAFSSDGQLLASASVDTTIALHRVSDGTLLRVLRWEAPVQSIAFSSDPHVLLAAYQNGSIVRWDVEAGRILQSFETGTTIQSMAYSSAGELFAAGDTDGTIRLWYQTDRGYRKQTFVRQHRKAVSSLAFSQDGQWLVSGSWDKTFTLWRVKLQLLDEAVLTARFTSVPADGTINSVAMDPDGRLLAAGDAFGVIQVWRFDDQSVESVNGRGTCLHTGGVTSLAFTPDGQALASAGTDMALKLWRASDCAPIQTLQQIETGKESIVQTIAFSPDGLTLAAGDWGHMAQFWKAQP